MIKLKKCIIMFVLFSFIFSLNFNLTSAYSEDISSSEKHIQIPVNGFIGNMDNGHDDFIEDDESNNNIDKLPQTGASDNGLIFILSILLIVIGYTLIKKNNKQKASIK